MFKLSVICLFIAGLSSCNSSGGGGSSSNNNSTWNTYSVTQASELPTCSSDIVGRLYYIESTNVFQVCKSSGWTTIGLGSNVSSIKNISQSSTDYCTQNTGEICLFMGGQLITFADGTKIISYRISYLLSLSGELDADDVSESVVIPSTYTAATKNMYPYVARGSGYKTMAFAWQRSSEALIIYLDVNSDGTYTAGTDELLYTPTLTSL